MAKPKPKDKSLKNQPTKTLTKSTGTSSRFTGANDSLYSGGRWFSRGGRAFDELKETQYYVEGADAVQRLAVNKQAEIMGWGHPDHIAWLAGFMNAWHCQTCRDERGQE